MTTFFKIFKFFFTQCLNKHLVLKIKMGNMELAYSYILFIVIIQGNYR